MSQLIIIAKLPSSPYSQPDRKIYIFLKPSLYQCIFKKYLIDINIIGYFLTASMYGFEVYRYISNTAICFKALCFLCNRTSLSPGMWQRESRDRKRDPGGRTEAGDEVCGKRTFEKGEKLGREISIVRMFFKLKVPQSASKNLRESWAAWQRTLHCPCVLQTSTSVRQRKFQGNQFCLSRPCLDLQSSRSSWFYVSQQGQMITQQKLVLFFTSFR